MVFSCEYCKIFKGRFFFQFESNFAQNSLQFALRQPEKNLLLEWLYFHVDITIDNRLFQKRETGSQFTQGKESGTRTYYHVLPDTF